jgi:hypothetical protein
MIIAALWIVFLIGFVAGCAWANSVRTPTLRPTSPAGRDATTERLERAQMIAIVEHARPLSVTDAIEIRIRHNTEPGARN